LLSCGGILQKISQEARHDFKESFTNLNLYRHARVDEHPGFIGGASLHALRLPRRQRSGDHCAIDGLEG
jgi:hypothetical protein